MYPATNNNLQAPETKGIRSVKSTGKPDPLYMNIIYQNWVALKYISVVMTLWLCTDFMVVTCNLSNISLGSSVLLISGTGLSYFRRGSFQDQCWMILL